MHSNSFYTGCVESRNDPLKLGRCQVRIVGLHTENKIQLPTADLPWAYPVQPITSAGTSGIGTAPIGPVEGTWVLIMFMDPDCQMPIMMGTLGGAYQSPEAAANGELTINTIDASGSTQSSTSSLVLSSTQDAVTAQAEAQALPQGKLADDGSIIGPLAKLIAKAESGADGYNAYNRGTVNGKIVGGSGKIDLTTMPIKDIMAKQALPPGSPDRLFAVGKYQTIPVTLKASCQALNIDVNQPFTAQTQDIICQEYLVAKKRPPLVAYYKNPDKNNEKLLMDAGQSLAAEFASIEDPYFLGYPYKGPEGTYYKSGNRAHTKWTQIKSTLLAEWDFRNNKTSPPPTATIADNDKVAKGTDYTGVAKQTPIDDSVTTPPKASASAPAAAVEPASPLSGLGALTDLNSALSGVMDSISSSLTELVNTIDLNGAISDLTDSAGSILSDFGSSLNEIAENLGIENLSGSVTELAANLGLSSPSKETLIAELEKRAGSSQGQAKSLLAKIEAEGEPSVATAYPIGTTKPDGSISTGTTVDSSVGFQDPNGVYPKYANEQDTNRLATGNNLGRTVVLKKEASLKTGVRIANGGTWDQSPVPYNATYPYNKVTQTESGHIAEFDDTPGSERIHTYHKAGSFTEIDANGTRVNRIVGDGFEVLERNGFIYVKGAYCVTVDGAMNLRTDNVFNLEVSGAANINIFNDANINVSGSANLAVGTTLNAKANKINLESVGQFNIKAGTGLNIEAGKDINIKTAGSVNTQSDANINNKAVGGIFSQADGDVNIKAEGLVNVESSSSTNIKAGDDMNLESGGKASLLASGDVAIDGAILDMQDGNASSADSAEEADKARAAGFAEVELPVETRGTSGVSQLPPLTVTTRSSEVGFDSPNAGNSNAYVADRVANNQTSKSGVAEGVYAVQKDKPSAASASSPGTVAGLDQIRNMSVDQFTAGMKLSKYFTLGDLTKGGTRIPRTSYTVGGQTYTPHDIVCNLKVLAETTLDPIREKFGAFTITSAFRRAAPEYDLGKGIKEGGDHGGGCAADIVFPGSKQDNYDKCKEIVKTIPAWNQIIMEYNGGSQYWIHIAVRSSGNKGDMFTMSNHATFAGTYPRGGFVLV